MKQYGTGTKCVQAGYSPENGGPRQIPIIQSTTFKYDTSEDMGKLFDLETSGYFYSRLQNPTCDHVAAKIAAMETASPIQGFDEFRKSVEARLTALEQKSDTLVEAQTSLSEVAVSVDGMLKTVKEMVSKIPTKRGLFG